MQAISWLGGTLAILIVLAVLTNSSTNLPVVNSDRGALIALFVVGFAMCAGGIFRAQQTVGWLHPVTILGIALGTVIMATFGAAVAGQAAWVVKLASAVPSATATGSPDKAAFYIVAALMAVKWILGMLFLRAPAGPGI